MYIHVIYEVSISHFYLRLVLISSSHISQVLNLKSVPTFQAYIVSISMAAFVIYLCKPLLGGKVQPI